MKIPKRLLILMLWLSIVTGFYVLARQQNQSVSQLLTHWLNLMSASALGPLFLFGIYLLRPLLLLPITILTVFSGFLFGAFWGSVYALVATLMSSALAYALGRWFARNGKTITLESGFRERLRQRSFETVLIGRLTFVPGDLINYGAGYLRIHMGAFLVATALGGLPGLLIAVLAGASTEGQFDMRAFKLNPAYLLASLGLLVITLLLSRGLRRRRDTSSMG